MAEAYICDAVRTPIGRYGGSLSGVRADDLAANPIKALIERHDLASAAVDDVIIGCANQLRIVGCVNQLHRADLNRRSLA